MNHRELALVRLGYYEFHDCVRDRANYNKCPKGHIEWCMRSKAHYSRSKKLLWSHLKALGGITCKRDRDLLKHGYYLYLAYDARLTWIYTCEYYGAPYKKDGPSISGERLEEYRRLRTKALSYMD